MRRILLSLISLILLFTFTSCSGNRNNELTPEETSNNLITNINTNLVNCTNISYDSTIKSGDVLLKEIEKDVMIVKNSDGTVSLTINTTNKTLGSNFDLVEQILTDYIDGQLPETLFNYSFNYNAFSSISMENNSITGVIKSSEVSNVLKTTVNNSSDLNVTINYSEDKITYYHFSYTSSNGNSIEIEANYSY